MRAHAHRVADETALRLPMRYAPELPEVPETPRSDPRHRSRRLGNRAELPAPGLDRAEPLCQPGPGPGFELLVAKGGLSSRRLEILETRVGFLDPPPLVGFTLSGHCSLPVADGERA